MLDLPYKVMKVPQADIIGNHWLAVTQLDRSYGQLSLAGGTPVSPGHKTHRLHFLKLCVCLEFAR